VSRPTVAFFNRHFPGFPASRSRFSVLLTHRRSEIRSQPRPFAAKSSGCSRLSAGTRRSAFIKAHLCSRRLSYLTAAALMLAPLVRPQSGDQPQDVAEHLSRHRDLGHVEHDIAAVADHLGADLDQLLPPTRRRPLRLPYRRAVEGCRTVSGGAPSSAGEHPERRWSRVQPDTVQAPPARSHSRKPTAAASCRRA
jgi:hypothetical protein